MGWKTDIAYENAERDEWIRFMADQTPWRRFRIRLAIAIRVAAIAALLIGPIAFGIYYYHL
ncbi:hypothetical protein [Mesorhizobium australicum]|uniref:Uncharacterized protein n=1 Tax=Mesorhizobium australicum TaxID=536018 RepID=A0A1X7NWA4_9HYPH|nr:hypothetical protein [Mesorhizobium australicum]SMH42430.1 hypothetical protein SAMN02982922_2740 [Mesorhizobium australicum]